MIPDIDAIMRRVLGEPKQPGLVVISTGLGRDSTTIEALMVEGRLPIGDGRIVGPEGVAAVVFSDTGYEWGFTSPRVGVKKPPVERDALTATADLLAAADVPFYVLATPPRALWEPWWKARRKEWLAAFTKIETLRNRAIDLFVKSRQIADPSRAIDLRLEAVELRDQAANLWVELSHPKSKGPRPWQTAALANASIEAKAAGGFYHSEVPLLERVLERSRPVILRSKGGGRVAECTDKHKIQPIRKFLSDLVAQTYPEIRAALGQTVIKMGTERGKRVPVTYLQRKDLKGKVIRFGDQFAALKLYAVDVRAGKREQIKMLIGYAADEMQRVARGAEGRQAAPEYVRAAIDEVYPLVMAGIGKAEEVEILERHGLNWVRKSGCLFCPESGPGWFWALSEFDPPMFKRLVRAQKETMARNPKFTWLGSKRTLPETVKFWRQRNPTKTVDEILNKGYARCGAFNRTGSFNRAGSLCGCQHGR